MLNETQKLFVFCVVRYTSQQKQLTFPQQANVMQSSNERK